MSDLPIEAIVACDAEVERLRARVAELEDQRRETVPPRLLEIEAQSLAACRGCLDEAVGVAKRFAESGVRDKLIAAQFIYTLAGILSARAANGEVKRAKT